MISGAAVGILAVIFFIIIIELVIKLINFPSKKQQEEIKPIEPITPKDSFILTQEQKKELNELIKSWNNSLLTFPIYEKDGKKYYGAMTKCNVVSEKVLREAIKRFNSNGWDVKYDGIIKDNKGIERYSLTFFFKEEIEKQEETKEEIPEKEDADQKMRAEIEQEVEEVLNPNYAKFNKG